MRKLLWWLIGIIAFVLVALFIAVPIIANNQLDKAIAGANENGNVLKIGNRDLSYRLTHLNLTLDSIEIDQDRNGQQYVGSLGRVAISGIQLLPLISKKIRISDLVIDRPDLEMMPGKSEADTTIKRPDTRIKNIELIAGSFDRISGDGDLEVRILGANSTVAGLSLPLAPAAAPNLVLKVDSLFFPQEQRGDWSINGVEVNTEMEEIKIATVRLSPKQTARAFLTSLEYKDDWLAIRMDDIVFSKVPIGGAVAGEKVVLQDTKIGDFNLRVFENPNLPSDPGADEKSFPVESLRKLDYPLLLERIEIARTNISYGMLQDDKDTPDVSFNDGRVVLSNWSSFEQPDSAIVEGDFTFEDNSPLQVRFALDQAGDGRHFSGTGKLGDYNLVKINPLMVAAAGATINTGNLRELTYNFSAANDASTGNLICRYDELDVTMEGSFIKDFLAGMAVRKSNPRPDGDLMIGTIDYEHDGTKSFFNFYWKSLVAGLTSSAVGDLFKKNKLQAEEVDGEE